MAVPTFDGLVLDHLGAIRALLHGGPLVGRRETCTGYPTRRSPLVGARASSRGSMARDGRADRGAGVGQRHEPAGAPGRPGSVVRASPSCSPIGRASARSGAPRIAASRPQVIEPGAFSDRDAIRRRRGRRCSCARCRRRRDRRLHAAARPSGARCVRRTLAQHASGVAAVVPRDARRCATRSTYGVKVTGVTVFLVDERRRHRSDRRAGGGHGPRRRRLALPRGPDPRGRAPAAPGSRPGAGRGAALVDGRRVTGRGGPPMVETASGAARLARGLRQARDRGARALRSSSSALSSSSRAAARPRR